MCPQKKSERSPGAAKQKAEPSADAFAKLGVSPPLCKALVEMGWFEPTEIQEKMIPLALAGKDILGQAQTGTGKTGAFGLPILQQMPSGKGVRCLILAPTRELAAQVAGEIRRLGRFTQHGTMVAYGGTRVRSQVEGLKRNPAVVVGTPGRVMDLMNRRLLLFDNLRFAVLDEVDRMLDIGFRDDIRRILGKVKTAHQTIFVSATIDDEINVLARQYMYEPTEVFCAPDKLTVDEVDQSHLSVAAYDKARMLVELVRAEQPEHALVFTRTRRATTRVAKYLRDKGIDAKEIHGDLFQSKRDKIMSRFRRGDLHVLVATDLASRGLDIDDISHVINYDIPEDPEVYVHRIGRTARMGQPGKAITLVTPEQGGELTKIEVLINCEVPVRTLKGFKAGSPPRQEAKAASAPTTPRPPVRRVVGGKVIKRSRRRL